MWVSRNTPIEKKEKMRLCCFCSPNHQDHHTEHKLEPTKLANMWVSRNNLAEKMNFE